MSNSANHVGLSDGGEYRSSVTVFLRNCLMFVVVVFLSACGDGASSDLVNFVQQTRSKQQPNVEEVPEFKPYEPYRYTAADLRDPFEVSDFSIKQQKVALKSGAGARCPVHDPEPLEVFALDSLRMVGTLEQEGTMWGLIRATDGTIHRIKINHYIGQNCGKILKVSENRVELLEIVPDGSGGLMERAASLALKD